MNRRRILKLIKGIIGGLILCALCMLVFGCASTPMREPAKYDVRAFSVVVCSHEEIQQKYKEISGYDTTVNGFFDYSTRTAYVPYDNRFEDKPDLYVFGHEVWHLPELGWGFHK